MLWNHQSTTIFKEALPTSFGHQHYANHNTTKTTKDSQTCQGSDILDNIRKDFTFFTLIHGGYYAATNLTYYIGYSSREQQKTPNLPRLPESFQQLSYFALSVLELDRQSIAMMSLRSEPKKDEEVKKEEDQSPPPYKTDDDSKKEEEDKKEEESKSTIYQCEECNMWLAAKGEEHTCDPKNKEVFG